MMTVVYVEGPSERKLPLAPTLHTLKGEEGTSVTPDISFICLRSSWRAADNPRRHKGHNATEHMNAFIYSQLLQGGECEYGAFFSAEWRCPAGLRDPRSMAAERLGVSSGCHAPRPPADSLGGGRIGQG